MPRIVKTVTVKEVTEVPQKQKKSRAKQPPKKLVVRNTTVDRNDCHHIPELDEFLGQRSIIKTTKGTCRGRLVYSGGWYYCQSAERLIEGQWINLPNRFLFRKGQFQSIVRVPTENGAGR